VDTSGSLASPSVPVEESSLGLTLSSEPGFIIESPNTDNATAVADPQYAAATQASTGREGGGNDASEALESQPMDTIRDVYMLAHDESTSDEDMKL
jgi:hypothetical protein